MKTLSDHTLIYDNDCPLCVGYTNAFVKTKMLGKNGRKAFGNLTEMDKDTIDINKAQNEIALVNTKTKEVIYGLDSLLAILGHSMPLIKTIGQLKPVHFLLTKLYKFISYNRKVIISTPIDNNAVGCIPGFNRTYRWLYIVFATVVSTTVLQAYSKLLPTIVSLDNHLWEFLMCGGQIVFQGLILLFFVKDKILSYIGNMITVSLIGSLLLMPILLASIIAVPGTIFLVGYFLLVVVFMVLLHQERVSNLQLPTYLTITWILYRLLWIPILTI